MFKIPFAKSFLSVLAYLVTLPFVMAMCNTTRCKAYAQCVPNYCLSPLLIFTLPIIASVVVYIVYSLLQKKKP